MCNNEVINAGKMIKGKIIIIIIIYNICIASYNILSNVNYLINIAVLSMDHRCGL